MYVLYNIQGNVLLIKLMRKLYQILYNVGRLTYAPGGGLFLSRGGTLWRGLFSFPGGHFGVGSFPFRGTLWRGQVCEGERHSELRSPLFPLALPLSGHVAVLRCGMLQCVGKCLYAAVLAMYSCADGVCRTEGGLRSRPVPGGCCIVGTHLLLTVVVFLALTCFLLSLYCWHSPVSDCCCIAGADQLPPVVVASLA